MERERKRQMKMNTNMKKGRRRVLFASNDTEATMMKKKKKKKKKRENDEKREEAGKDKKGRTPSVGFFGEKERRWIIAERKIGPRFILSSYRH